jgi:hypothetical protein
MARRGFFARRGCYHTKFGDKNIFILAKSVEAGSGIRPREFLMCMGI